MTELSLNYTSVADFFITAVMRYDMLLRRRRGEEEVTTVAALRDWRFCNVFREDDRTTIWIRQNVREPNRATEDVVWKVALCRYTNRIPTMTKLLEAGLFDSWDMSRAADALASCSPITGAAYCVNTTGRGWDKASGIAAIVDEIRQATPRLVEFLDATQRHLRPAWEWLRGIRNVGGFMAYEIVSDLRHTDLLADAPDALTWAYAGPGAELGLRWMVHRDLDARVPRREHLRLMRELLHLARDGRMEHAGHPWWPVNWPRWEMREVEHWLCEFAKWVKVAHYGMRLKRRYP